ncbi:Two-component response regulator ARR9 [Hibiscus syriacus]|uniref:Two-component response regulator ARR9 n=1 Tax=Hibiscus syriacus TaxID=106335 RepID=A0A6A2X384_HIBSY|nr:Two-component response regulator ARR9 [Hibiscus syriacus]
MELMKSDDTVLNRQPWEEEIMQKQKKRKKKKKKNVAVFMFWPSMTALSTGSYWRSSSKLFHAKSGEKALEYLGLLHNSTTPASSSQQHQGLNVNLIMTDFSMPGTSGYDLLKRVKGSSWKDVPVVVMSSENVPSRISMCLEGGAEEFMLKPLQLSDLHKIQAHLLKSLPHP